MPYLRSKVFLRLLFLIFLPVLFLASCDNSRQTQNASSNDEAFVKKDIQEGPSLGEKRLEDSKNAGSTEKMTQAQRLSSEKKDDLSPGSSMESGTVNAIVVPGESRKETPRAGDVDEGETRNVSRFPENIQDYEPEDITEYPDKTPKDPSQDPEAPVSNKD